MPRGARSSLSPRTSRTPRGIRSGEGLPRRRCGTRRAARPAGQGTRLRRRRFDSRRDGAARLQAGRQGLSRYSCIPRRTRSTRLRAPSARAAAATKGSRSTPRPRSRWRKTSNADLTINAMAKAEDGTLIDPFGGKKDLESGVLRHVSEAFAEDPVRILRVARFAARFGFRMAEETLALMKHMVLPGETDYLVPERVWQEFSRGLAEPPSRCSRSAAHGVPCQGVSRDQGMAAPILGLGARALRGARMAARRKAWRLCASGCGRRAMYASSRLPRFATRQD